MTVADADEHEFGASLPDCVPLAVHLYRLLAAEHSAKVAEEHEHHGPFRPQLVKAVSAAREVQDHGGCCFIRYLHHDRMLADRPPALQSALVLPQNRMKLTGGVCRFGKGSRRCIAGAS